MIKQLMKYIGRARGLLKVGVAYKWASNKSLQSPFKKPLRRPLNVDFSRVTRVAFDGGVTILPIFFGSWICLSPKYLDQGTLAFRGKQLPPLFGPLPRVLDPPGVQLWGVNYGVQGKNPSGCPANPYFPLYFRPGGRLGVQLWGGGQLRGVI